MTTTRTLATLSRFEFAHHIDRPRIPLVKNLDADKGFLRSVVKYCGSSEAAYQISKGFLHKLPDWVNEVRESLGKNRVGALDTLSKNGGGAWPWTATFIRFVQVVHEAHQSQAESRESLVDGSTPSQIAYKNEKAANDTMEAAAMGFWSAYLIATVVPKAQAVAQVFKTGAESISLTHDMASLHMDYSNLRSAYQVDLTGATEEMKDAVDQTRNNTWISVVKNVCSVAGGFFGFVAMITGISLISKLIMSTFSLGSPMFAIVRRLHEENMTYKPIKFALHA